QSLETRCLDGRRSLALSQRQSAGQSGPHSQCASGDHARAPQRTYSARVVREPALQTVPLLCNPPPIMTSKRKTLGDCLHKPQWFRPPKGCCIGRFRPISEAGAVLNQPILPLRLDEVSESVCITA